MCQEKSFCLITCSIFLVELTEKDSGPRTLGFPALPLIWLLISTGSRKPAKREIQEWPGFWWVLGRFLVDIPFCWLLCVVAHFLVR